MQCSLLLMLFAATGCHSLVPHSTLWRTKTDDEWIREIAFSADGNTVAAAVASFSVAVGGQASKPEGPGKFLLCDANSRGALEFGELPTGLTGVAISPDGKTLAACSHVSAAPE